MSTNVTMDENLISSVLMLKLSLSMTAHQSASLTLPDWNSSPVAAESFPLLQSVFQTCFSAAYNWHPVTLSMLYENKMYCSIEGEQLLDPCVFSTYAASGIHLLLMLS